ncbi:pyruvate kinase [Aphanomyces invadans]|uniref:Pyruvate kinase n=1 Tax=Aphanomyces invadans TaxID=157072 RepID=A0A024U3F2_9STRA|nr:pyruvate kinase [Aphanomyces invadans]ETW00158.1 pyruvate kinase [Aphanomyces invadans]|eukprot:XP_008871183.1 pyruvate kinase [Aphanomyces invadans]
MHSANQTLSPRSRLVLGGGWGQRPRSMSTDQHETNTTSGDIPKYKVEICESQILDRDFTLHRQRKTKIVCAIGPSCWSVEMLGKLLDAGMNVARFNFSHGDHSVHSTALANLRTAIDQRENCHCAVLLDTKGPEIRTGLLKNHTPLHLTAGQTLTISTDDTIEGDYTRIGCNYPHLATSVAPGSRILCDDGALQLEVIACRDSKVDVRVLNSHVLEERKNMCLPGAKIRVPGITEKDKYDLEHFALPQGVDIVSGSFVRSADNVRALRACLGDAGKHIRIHAKIESIEALENLDEILEEADGIHVSRGDLGMELQPEQVFLAQKLIIRKANIAGKPVVTSTQMLQSMTKCPTPTSAECSDVANAVLDGTDAVMLSAETAKGEFPVEAVATMSRICIEAEGSLNYSRLYAKTREATSRPVDVCEAVSSSAVETALDVQAKLIVSLTDSGFSSLKIAKYRPKALVVAVTALPHVARQLAGLSRGISVLRVETMTGTDDLILKAIEFAKARGWIDNGDMVVVLHGLTEALPGMTSVVKIIEAQPYGYASPMHQKVPKTVAPQKSTSLSRFTF